MVPEPTIRGVSAWIAELPLANTRYCFDAVEAALESFNHRPELQMTVRVELAELLRPTVLMLAQRAEARFIEEPVPYTAEAGFHIRQGIALHKELGMCYALAAFDALATSRRGENIQALALYRAQAHWGQLLLWTSQLYREVDEEYWMILYRLFRVAEARRTLGLVFDEPDEPAPCRTAGGIFIRTLLFAAAGARRLRQRDMSMVFNLLGQWLERVGFGTEMVRDEQAAEFYVDVGGALPPARTRLPNGFEVSDPRFLHTQPLVRALLDPDVVAGRSPHDRTVLIRVARSLGAMEKRKYARRAEADACRCVVGLSSLVASLADPQASGHGTTASRKTGLELVREGYERLSSSREQFETRALRNEVGLGNLLLKRRKGMMVGADDIWSDDPEDAASKEKPPVMVEGRIVNSSARGCRIVWPGQPEGRAKVGELVGVWLGQPGQFRFIAVVRWLECGKQGLHLGMELFSPSAQAVEIYDTASKPKGKALFLAADGVLRRTPELLVLPGAVRQGGVVRVRSGGDVTSYWVSEELESSLSFVRYALMELAPEDDTV